ncbi:ATP-binding protein [Candidatus Nanohalococcus occultus]|uniref:ATP-binding protein n=1 Tax=Candidatus Nanohalococcus occultus TaxID=2978047 RepID=UPI0039E05B97
MDLRRTLPDELLDRMQLGTIEGEVDTSAFKFRAVEDVGKFDFVSVKSNERWILAQVEEVTKKPDGETLAEANIIGYRDKGLTKAPRQVIEPDSIVYEADQELIAETLGLEDAGLGIGNLETNPDIDIFVDESDFYKHFAVLAQTGAGKSYLTGVLTEELLEQEFPILILDPHGEYSSLEIPNPERSEGAKGYDVREFSPNTDVNSEAMPLRFSSVNMEKKELLEVIPDSLTNSQMGVLYNALKRLREKGDDYTLNDIMDAVSQEDSTAKWNLLNSMEQIEESGLFSETPTNLKDLLEPGRATIINLKAVEPEATEMTAYLLAKRLFDLRKRDRVPPFVMLMEEAHNFAPEQGFGKALSSEILRKIASEGRKFGLGIGVVSQRPARIDKNVLSQCNTQFILRVSNPNDIKAISKSFEGVTSEVESMITSLPPGVCFVLGNEYPVMTQVRQRYSKHGGTTQTAEDYEQKTTVDCYLPQEDIDTVRQKRDGEYSIAYYPLYHLETDDVEILVDGVEGDVKAERKKPSGLEKQVLEKLRNGLEKSEIVNEIDMTLTKMSSIQESLVEKGLVHEDRFEPKESVLDVDLVERDATEPELIDYKIDEKTARNHLEGAKVRKLRYPYYSSGDSVYDPILNKQL